MSTLERRERKHTDPRIVRGGGVSQIEDIEFRQRKPVEE